MNHVFFQEFNVGGGNKSPKKETKEQKIYKYNCIILEIATNWDFIRELMYEYRNNLIARKISSVDADWIKFIVNNNIDIVQYKNDFDKFIQNNLK